jgi:ferredoxin
VVITEKEVVCPIPIGLRVEYQMKVVVDKEKCVASGQCVMLAPEVFDQDDDGVVMVLDSRPSGVVGDRVRQAARVCPTSLISLSE